MAGLLTGAACWGPWRGRLLGPLAGGHGRAACWGCLLGAMAGPWGGLLAGAACWGCKAAGEAAGRLLGPWSRCGNGEAAGRLLGPWGPLWKRRSGGPLSKRQRLCGEPAGKGRAVAAARQGRSVSKEPNAFRSTGTAVLAVKAKHGFPFCFWQVVDAMGFVHHRSGGRGGEVWQVLPLPC